MTLGWPVATFVAAARVSAKRAREGRSSFIESFTTLYRAALTRNVPPYDGAIYEAVLGRRATDLADVLLPVDLPALQRLSIRRGAVLQDVQDKARFAEICRCHGLACVPTLAVFNRGGSQGEEAIRTWTKPLFVKALSGNRGVGAELWRPGGRGFISSGGDDCTVDELLQSLRPQNCIVQPVLEDNAALKAFGTAALSNVRIVTAKGGGIPATPIAAAISLAAEAGSLTGHEGVHCGIDVGAGAITAILESAQEDARSGEPDPIGFKLPQWDECLSLVCKAHDDAFPAFVALGWDLALTEDGPVLLEANVNWGMLGHQRLTGPLGETALADVIDELLAPGTAGRCPADYPSTQAFRSPEPVPRASPGSGAARGRRRRPPARKAS
jgi:glutathione synthase/RimK-type ligase-like ATP-grasp enzyme